MLVPKNARVVRLGEILHVNAMRIGYTPALIDYVDGRAVAPKTP
jgi:hypothetical protein